MAPSTHDDRPGLSERWAGLGRGAALTLDSVELWSVVLPFRTPVGTAQGAHQSRPLVLVRMVGRTSDLATPVEGWGECAALADTTFDNEDVDRSSSVLLHQLLPGLLARTAADGGLLPRPADLDDVHEVAPRAALAFAALEMAVADAHLRAREQSLADLLGVAGRIVQPGAVVGTAANEDELVTAVGRLVDQGYSRVKVKIAPGWDAAPLEALSVSFPDLRMQVDANGSYRPGSPDEELLVALDRFGLLCIEQPFDRADLSAHSRLASRMATPICLDESLDSPGTVVKALATGACSVVCVKPARLGGLGAALSVIETCSQAHVPLWMGGMFESGYARGVNTALGALGGMSWPGDLSPARTYLVDDLVPDTGKRLNGPDDPVGRSMPSGPGMGPPPTIETLTRLGGVCQGVPG
jgi:o-succinylbenzoate synthase